MSNKYKVEQGKYLLQQRVLGKLINYMQKNEMRLLLNTMHKGKIKMNWV